MRSNFLILIFILGLIGCSAKKQEPDPLKAYDLNEEDVFDSNLEVIDVVDVPQEVLSFKANEILKDKITFSEVADSLWLVKLEDSEHSLIGDIDKIECNEQGIFVLDRRKARSILHFSLNGKFEKEIGRYGKGLGEYLSPKDFYLDLANDEISVFDGKLNKILIYSIDNGQFIREFRLGFFPHNLSKIDSLYVFNLAYKPHLHSNKIANFMLLFTDENGKIVKKSLKYPNITSEFLLHFVQQNYFYYSGEELYFRPPYSDTIYNIKTDEVRARYSISNELRIPREAYFNISFEDFMEKYMQLESPNSFVVPFGNVFETDRYLLLSEFFKTRKVYYLWDKAQNVNYSFSSVDDDKYGGLGRIFNPIAIEGNRLIMGIDPRLFTNPKNRKDIDYSQLPQSILDVVNNVKEYDNPVLMFVRLK